MRIKMNNKEKLIKAIENTHPSLKEEIIYQLEDVEHEDKTYDIADAFEDAMDLIESQKDKDLFNYLKNLFIEIGYAVPVDISEVLVSGGKKYWFKKNGIYYDAIESWQSWVRK